MIADVIIVGGGPAGSTAATLLARRGFEVTLLEREQFPREHVGESLLPFTYDILEDLGVLSEMEGRFSRKPGVTFSNVDGSKQSHWCFNRVIDGPQAISFHVRRAAFDDILLRNSEKHGTKVIEQARVTNINLNTTEVHYIDKTGREQIVSGRFIIDASGQGALLARQLKSQKPFKRLHIRQALSAHWEGVNYPPTLEQKNIEIVHLGGEKLGWIWLIPLMGELSIGVALNMSYAQAERKRFQASGTENWAEALYLQELRSSPEVARIIDGGLKTDNVALNGDFSYYSETKFGSNFAIIGDASGFLDPIFSSGIYLAMQGAREIVPGIEELLKTKNHAMLAGAYDLIAGGYQVVEELICTFYQEERLEFAEIGESEMFSFEHFEAAYSILHLILAGDFFTNHEKYLNAIRLLKRGKNMAKFNALTGHEGAHQLKGICSIYN